MTILWPGFLLLLALVPTLVGLYVLVLRRRRRAGLRYSSLSLVREALPASSRWRRHLPFALFALSLVSLIAGLARPAVILDVPTGQTTILLAIDVSRSMCSSDIAPSRLEAAEAAASRFIERQAPNARIGIVAFAGFGEVIQAPTADRELLFDAIDSLAVGRRTAIGSGILKSIDAIAEADPRVAPSVTDPSGGVTPPAVPQGDYAPDIIVVLTDGVSNAGPEPVDAAQQAVDRGLRVYTIGFGTADPGAEFGICAPQLVGREPGANQIFGGGGFGGGGFGGGGFRRGIDEDTLKQVSKLTGGTYYPADSADQLEKVFEDLPTNLITKHEVVEISVLFAALGALLVGLALLLARAWRPLP